MSCDQSPSLADHKYTVLSFINQLHPHHHYHHHQCDHFQWGRIWVATQILTTAKHIGLPASNLCTRFFSSYLSSSLSSSSSSSSSSSYHWALAGLRHASVAWIDKWVTFGWVLKSAWLKWLLWQTPTPAIIIVIVVMMVNGHPTLWMLDSFPLNRGIPTFPLCFQKLAKRSSSSPTNKPQQQQHAGPWRHIPCTTSNLSSTNCSHCCSHQLLQRLSTTPSFSSFFALSCNWLVICDKAAGLY